MQIEYLARDRGYWRSFVSGPAMLPKWSRQASDQIRQGLVTKVFSTSLSSSTSLTVNNSKAKEAKLLPF